eukprot:GDKK01032962.1.p1 GENE.GDKK01032962.1~~GDKK01032962.1.p1  ORF type:complete len:216 (-),score=62.30 GDKK01032962.1:92-715(-)
MGELLRVIQMERAKFQSLEKDIEIEKENTTRIRRTLRKRVVALESSILAISPECAVDLGIIKPSQLDAYAIKSTASSISSENEILKVDDFDSLKEVKSNDERVSRGAKLNSLLESSVKKIDSFQRQEHSHTSSAHNSISFEEERKLSFPEHRRKKSKNSSPKSTRTVIEVTSSPRHVFRADPSLLPFTPSSSRDNPLILPSRRNPKK